MKYNIVLVIICFSLLFHSSVCMAGPGDTIKMQTFTFGSPQDAWFEFPSDTININKILMYYTLKCNPAQNPACGEWDYQTSTNIYEHTGLLDSTLLSAPNYLVNGTTPDSMKFMFQPSYSYFPHYNTQVVYTGVTSFDSTYVGNGNISSTHPFTTAFPEGRSQYIWKASEMLAAGMQAGDISGFRFYVSQLGSTLKNLCIRIRHTAIDSLMANSFENTGFTTVYANHTTFGQSGWNAIHFITPFSWNGTNNIIIDISFDNENTGVNTSILSTNSGWKSGIHVASIDKSLFFYGNDFVTVPKQSMASVDSAVTVSFWCYGNPALQPQNQSTFEASNSNGNRTINVHLPWSNSRIYWDAGNSGTNSYDRIDKAATTAEIEGQWNYWTFTKNAQSGISNIYLNGNIWHTGSGLSRRMYGTERFKIGSASNGSNFYDGYLNEFALWNKELDANTIKEWMYRDLKTSHPYHSNLQLYYKFDDNSMLMVADSSNGNHTGTLSGIPTFQYVKGKDLVRNFEETMLRPNVIFEQGIYSSHIDTIITVDSLVSDAVQVFFYSDSLQPLVCIDTILLWPSYYNNYVYNNLGQAIDSTLVIPDTTIYKKPWYYYGTPFEVINRYEIGRYITPYGNGLSLGDGFTWVFDVSDYRTLLKDSVHLTAGNWQELLDLKFIFIKGTPPRKILNVENLWNGNFDYGYANNPIENRLIPKKVFIPLNVGGAKLKSRITGHGMDTPENCAEFCPKNHYFKTDGIQRYQQLVWRGDCGQNPLYPQGGTWIYDRSNWCPGAEVRDYDFELTPFITPNDTVVIDHDVEPYTHTGGWSYYQIEDQLITYGAPNFALDAELYEVISPSSAQMHQRKNPICNNPTVIIRNSGATTLTSLVITYGVQGTGTQPSTFTWQGNLKFMEKETVTLEALNWTNTNGTFYATVSTPNGGTDMYPFNNTYYTKHGYTPKYPNDLVIEFRTNLAPEENSYTLQDDQGNVILQKSTFTASTTHRDTVHLSDGCYDFTLYDLDGDGISFWANDDGNGYIRIKNALSGGLIKTFVADFGSKAWQQFTVGYTLENEEYLNHQSIEIYPNPSTGQFTIDMLLAYPQDIEIKVFDYQGKIVYTGEENNILESKKLINLENLPNGLFFVMIKSEVGRVTKKIILQN